MLSSVSEMRSTLLTGCACVRLSTRSRRRLAAFHIRALARLVWAPRAFSPSTYPRGISSCVLYCHCVDSTAASLSSACARAARATWKGAPYRAEVVVGGVRRAGRVDHAEELLLPLAEVGPPLVREAVVRIALEDAVCTAASLRLREKTHRELLRLQDLR